MNGVGTFAELIRKYTAGVVAIAIVFMAAGFFATKFIGATNTSREDCREEVRTWKELYQTERKEKDEVYKALAIKSGALNEVKKTTDSVFTGKVIKEVVKP